MPILSNFPGGSGSGGGGLSLDAVSNITTQVSSGKVYVKWTDPDDISIEGATLASWGGTLLVRKAGSMPSSRRDGTIVLDSTTRDQYANSYFCDSGLTDGIIYYYKLFPYTTTGAYTDSTENEFSATPTTQVTGIDNWIVTGMSASSEAGDGLMTVKWTDPSATITADGLTLATWASTTVVVKAGGYPTSKDDANAVYTLKSTTRNKYSSSALTVTGLTNGTTYYVGFFPETTNGGINAATSQRTTGVANRITIGANPVQSGTLTYNGNSQSPTWSNYSTTQMSIGGVTSSTNAGSYTATFTPTTNYRWSDGSTGAKSVAWSIAKAEGSLTITPAAITLNSGAKTATFTVTRSGDGKITATSSNTSVATVSPASSTATGTVTFTVSSVNSMTGSANITIAVAAGTNYKATANKTCVITASFKPVASTTAMSGVTYTDGLAGISAADISLLAGAISNNSSITRETSTVYVDYGSIHRKINVGDQVSIAHSGGNFTYAKEYAFDIIGFNHDDLTTVTDYGDVTATGKAGITLQMHGVCDFPKPINTNTKAKWSTCYMRATTLPSLIQEVDNNWVSIIKPVNKTTPNYNDTIETTSDSLFLLSEIEVSGRDFYAYPGGGYTYSYYKAGNNTVKNDGATDRAWWLRSVAKNDDLDFCYVGNYGSVGTTDKVTSDSGYYISYGFCV